MGNEKWLGAQSRSLLKSACGTRGFFNTVRMNREGLADLLVRTVSNVQNLLNMSMHRM